MNFTTIQQLEETGLVRAFSTHKGEGQWVKETAEARPGWQNLAAELHTPVSHLVRVNQKHTDTVLTIARDTFTSSDPVTSIPGGSAGTDSPGIPNESVDTKRQTISDDPVYLSDPQADGMITDIHGAALCISTADCVPVFLLDPKRPAIGLVHSGWRGTAMEIVSVAVRRMKEAYGSVPSDMIAVLGPHICADCYEVGEELISDFAAHYSRQELTQIFRPRNAGTYDHQGLTKNNDENLIKYDLDLSLAIRLSLLRAGLSDDRIYDIGICTFEDTRFNSYRRDHTRGELILSALMLV